MSDALAEEEFDEFQSIATTIESYVSNGVVMAGPRTTLRAAAAEMDQAGVGCLVIGESTSVEGIVSERDIVRAVAAGLDLDATTVADIETKALKWAAPGSTLNEVTEEMLENYVRHILVRDDDVLVGVVSMRDLLGAFLD